jgi:dihydrofolate reductase
MHLSIIVATDKNRLIGSKNKLPWHLPADLINFKNITLGKTIIMGRNTYQSIGKPLPNRKNIIITRNHNFIADDSCQIFNDIEKALYHLKNEDEVFIIGGSAIYAQTINKCNKLYITEINEEFNGDTYFPEFDKTKFKQISKDSKKPDKKNPYSYSFNIYQRLNY